MRTWVIGKAQEEATRLKTLTDQGYDPRELRAQELVKADAARAESKRKSTLVRDSLLAALPRRNEWVFSSPSAKAGRIADPRMPHNRALSVAGLNHVTLHGLRRSFSSLAEWVEMPTGVVAQIMGHAPNATAEKHYINRPLELLAVWHGKYEAWILEQAGIPFRRSQSDVNADGKSVSLGALRPVGAS